MDTLMEITTIEQNLPGIKRDIDQFEELLKRTEATKSDGGFLTQKYHALSTSTKILGSYLASLRKIMQSGIGPAETLRTKTLNDQIYTLITRLRGYGDRVQRVANSSSANAAALNFDSRPQGFMNDGFGAGVAQQVATTDFDETTAREMQQLERDIVQVNELFTTMATYVHDQGEMVDSIEANIESAYEQVSSGNSQLRSAVKYQNSARKRKLICFGFLFAVILIIIIIIIISVKSQR
ncbi:Syntaxin-7 [Cichlidogyrus casuarinus]|uniref:Syntaxin-7 n=1 Tax=Cichlidogyrus casuarinus TaxID=1844966 RepID=A0ABD2Q606_9PLAT